MRQTHAEAPRNGTAEQKARHEDLKRVDARRPSASHVEARRAGEIATRNELNAQQRHQKIDEDVDAALDRIDEVLNGDNGEDDRDNVIEIVVPAAGSLAVAAVA